MKEEQLDLVLVPLAILAMVSYHLWLLRRLLRHPTTTVIGINAISRRLWVQTMMEESSKNGVLSVQSLRNNIIASTLLASTAIMLTSLLAVLMASGGAAILAGGRGGFVIGGTGTVLTSVKFFAIITCFILAFLLNIQSVRYYSHASILVNVPLRRCAAAGGAGPEAAAEYVARVVNRGSYFWSLGLRAYYFSLPLFLWLWGPIPMLAAALLLLSALYFLDIYHGWDAPPPPAPPRRCSSTKVVHGDPNSAAR